MRKDKLRKINGVMTLNLMLILVLSMFVPIVATAEDTRLCPVGKTVGITAHTEGVRVVNTTEFETESGDTVSPAADAGVCCGDIILEINDKKVSSAEEFEKAIDNSKGEKLKLKLLRDSEEYEVNLKAEKRKDDSKLRIGVWLKDSSSGIGTLTYFDKKTGKFGALGHGICDENNFLTDVDSGSVHRAEITSLRKGEVGVPGELIAVFDEGQNIIGRVNANTNCGIFGTLNDDFVAEIGQTEEMSIANRSEVKEGEVTILSNVEGCDVCEYYGEITKINKDEKSSKGMIIKITDERLVDKTGGIVRGMSGSPIIQNGKLVGAITHVLVNDPARGYGIFIENMLAEAE